MSNKKKTGTKKPTQNTAAAKKPFPKGIIIAVVAVVLAVAVGVTVWLVKNKDSGTEKPKVDPIVTVDSDNSKYEMAEYKGTKMPVDFVGILNQVELDSYDACEKYGVALRLGERNISMPEFVLYYYDAYYFQTESAVYSMQQTGANRTGFDLTKLPRDQQYPREDYTWAEKFTSEAINTMSLNYMMFDEAVAKGVELSNAEISELMENFEFIEKTAKSDNVSLDEDLAATYCEGITAAMYKARDIVVAFATKYDTVRLDEIKNGYSEAVVDEKLKQSNDKYKVAKLRIYPIEGEYVESEAAAVKNEAQLLEYAKKNHPKEDYDAGFMTDCGIITKDKVSSVYGDEVAEWAFAGSRKAGDISVVEGMLYRYLVYVDYPAFYNTSCNIMFVGTQYEDTMLEEERQKIFKQNEERYLKWKNEDGTKEGFYDYSTNLSGIGEETVRLGTYYFMIDKWIFDPARKSGDSVMLDTEEGCCAIYYIGNNADDYDWNENLRNDMAVEDLKEYQQEMINRNYKADREDAVIKKAYSESDKSIKKRQKKLAENLGL